MSKWVGLAQEYPLHFILMAAVLAIGIAKIVLLIKIYRWRLKVWRQYNNIK